MGERLQKICDAYCNGHLSGFDDVGYLLDMIDAVNHQVAHLKEQLAEARSEILRHEEVARALIEKGAVLPKPEYGRSLMEELFRSWQANWFPPSPPPVKIEPIESSMSSLVDLLNRLATIQPAPAEEMP